MAETDRAITYMPHRTPKGYTHSSGLSFPIRGMEEQTFLLPLLKMGTDTTKIHIKTTDIPLFQIQSTSALTAGTTRSVYVKQTQTATQDSGYSRMVELTYASEYASGGDGAVLRVNCDYGSTGYAHGIMCVTSTEAKLPNGSMTRGAYYALELRVNAQTTSTWNSAGPVGFIRVRSTGAGVAEINESAYFMIFRGHTAAADAMVSLTSQTVKCSFSGEADPTTTVRYALFSQMQDGLGLGNTTTHMVLTDAATRAVDIYTDYSGTGPSWAINIDSTMGTTGVRGGVMYSCLTVDAVVPGSYIMNTFIKADYASVLTTAGFGMGAGLMVELVNPTDGSGGGEFHVLALEWTGATADTMHGNAGIPSSFIKFEGYGTAEADIDDHGYLFYVSGLNAGDGHLVDTTPNNADFAADAVLKVNILGTEYWLGLCDNKAGTA